MSANESFWVLTGSGAGFGPGAGFGAGAGAGAGSAQAEMKGSAVNTKAKQTTLNSVNFFFISSYNLLSKNYLCLSNANYLIYHPPY